MEKKSAIQKEMSKKLLNFSPLKPQKGSNMSVRVGNLIVFPGKGLFHLNRNGRQIVFFITKEGEIMIKVKGYDGYFLNYEKWEIYSSKSKKVIQPVKKAAVKSYELYKNGIKEIVPFFKIVQQHWPEIEMNYLQK